LICQKDELHIQCNVTGLREGGKSSMITMFIRFL